MASVYKRQRDRQRKGSSWYFTYTDFHGVRRTVKGCPDKAETERMARQLETAADLRRRGFIDPKDEAYAAHAARPLTEHLSDWRADLVGKGDTPAHATRSHHLVERLTVRIGAGKILDLSPSLVQTSLAGLRDEGLGTETINHHVRAIKGFSRWLWRDGRSREHVLAHLATSNPEADRRHRRRALTPEEATRLVKTAERGPVVHGMAGPDRAMAYRVALGTGFRREELRSLTPGSFRLDSEPPTIVCAASYTKNGCAALQPIAATLADALRPWLATQGPGRPVFTTLPKDRTAAMLRVDLEAAGIASETDAGVIDFHALRATYISHLVAAGASVKTCQVLARHASPSMTIGIYAKTSLHDLTGAVETLPNLTTRAPERKPQALLATGTDPRSTATAPGQRTADVSCRPESQKDADVAPGSSPSSRPNPELMAGLDASSRLETDADVSHPFSGRTGESIPRRTDATTCREHELHPMAPPRTAPGQRAHPASPATPEPSLLSDPDLAQSEGTSEGTPRQGTSCLTSPNLAEIVARWDLLPEAARETIMITVRETARRPDEENTP